MDGYNAGGGKSNSKAHFLCIAEKAIGTVEKKWEKKPGEKIYRPLWELLNTLNGTG
ncbi:MAG TPA: hypothetical protein VFU15_12010 [Bacteroidia bacterium]|nr:hypothetical protein [Bacteroidia bacterium]